MFEMIATLADDQLRSRSKRTVKVNISNEQVRDLAVMILGILQQELSVEIFTIENKISKINKEINFLQQKNRMKELGFVFPEVWKKFRNG